MIRLTILLVVASSAAALNYPHVTAEPQKSGWPLTAEERAYVTGKPEHDRRPGRESNKHLPQLWPMVPTAGHFGGDAWLKLHEAHVKTVQANQGPIDVLLVGDSITIQWGASWKQHFPELKAVNIGIGGDKTQNVLWRLDHGGVDGLQPRAIVLMIGNNNMFFTSETGIEAAAKGIEMCVKNLREKFPTAPLVLAKPLPAHSPGNNFYEDIKRTNVALDALKLESDLKVCVIDLWSDFTNADGTQKKEFFTPDNIHLSSAGYAAYAAKLKPLLKALLSGKPVPGSVPKPGASVAAIAPPATAVASASSATATIVLESKPVLTYPHAPYNEGRLDPQITGWPLTDPQRTWVNKGEYFRKPGHEVQQHLPAMWPVTPTAAHWKTTDGSEGNRWIDNHARTIAKVQASKDAIDVALIGDSITQGWGGGWDGAPFNPAWQAHFGALKTVNLGIGGDRVENVLWRLDHGALDGVSPRVVALLIGTNNAPLISANGVPVESVARAIQLCVQNIRARCPQSQVVLVKILPAFAPGSAVHEDIKRTNAALDAMKLDADPQVRMLDLTRDFTEYDGSLKPALYSDGHLHLSPDGYEVLARRVEPLFNGLKKL